MLHVLLFLLVTTSAVVSPELYETTQLLEQYEQNAERCESLACTDEELDGLDRDLLMLLGRRAAVLRQRTRLGAALRRKNLKIVSALPAARLAWLEQTAKELSVPKAFAQPVLKALLQAAERYEREGTRAP